MWASFSCWCTALGNSSPSMSWITTWIRRKGLFVRLIGKTMVFCLLWHCTSSKLQKCQNQPRNKVFFCCCFAGKVTGHLFSWCWFKQVAEGPLRLSFFPADSLMSKVSASVYLSFCLCSFLARCGEVMSRWIRWITCCQRWFTRVRGCQGNCRGVDGGGCQQPPLSGGAAI